MKQNLLLSLTFIFVLLFSLSVHADIYPSSQNIGNMTIFYPKTVFYPQNTDSQISIHSFDKNDVLLPNADYDCSLFVYDSLGQNVLYISSMINDSNGFDKYATINGSVHSTLGIKYYNVECGSVNDSGAVSESFYITRNGEEYFPETTTETNKFLVYSFLGLALIFLIISYLFKGEEKEVRHLRGVFFTLGIVHIIIISLIINSMSNCQEGLCGDINRFGVFGEAYFYVMGILLIYVIYTYFLARLHKFQEEKI